MATHRRMLRAHVKDAELGLERGDSHLVHLDVLAVELDVRHSVGHVSLVPHRTCRKGEYR
jgi:hypothetical protein